MLLLGNPGSWTRPPPGERAWLCPQRGSDPKPRCKKSQLAERPLPALQRARLVGLVALAASQHLLGVWSLAEGPLHAVVRSDGSSRVPAAGNPETPPSCRVPSNESTLARVTQGHLVEEGHETPLEQAYSPQLEERPVLCPCSPLRASLRLMP